VDADIGLLRRNGCRPQLTEVNSGESGSRDC
jgi:hypothetical protein